MAGADPHRLRVQPQQLGQQAHDQVGGRVAQHHGQLEGGRLHHVVHALRQQVLPHARLRQELRPDNVSTRIQLTLYYVM